jgi:chitodextrinase
MQGQFPGAAADGSVWIGAYSLEVAGSGSFARFEPEAERENARALAAALDQAADEPPPAVAAIEEFQESADEVTSRIEEADRLVRTAAAGDLLQLDNLTGEIDSLLDLFTRLDKAGRFEEELKLMRSLNGLLALTLRWLDLIRSLLALLRSAKDAGHVAGQAFAHHELGSLKMCAGRPDEAARDLDEALRLEEAIGDVAGRCATRHNLDSARRDALRQGVFGRPRGIQRLVILAGVIAIAAGSGAGIALAIHGDGNHQTTTTTPPGSHVVTVTLAGKGTGSVRGGGLACPTHCSVSVADGRTLDLVATAADGSVFTGWSQEVCGRATTCNLTVTQAMTVTATFAPAKDKQPPTTPTGLRAVAVNANQIDLSWVTSTDNVAVTGYVIYRDRLKLTTVSGTSTLYHDVGLMPSTGYIYSVQAVDAAGNSSPQSSLTKATTPAATDKVPPTTPANLQATSVSSSEIDLSWSASTDNVAVTGYVVYRDGVRLTTVAGTVTSFHDTDLDFSTRYVYTVQAVDAAGNSSPQSKPAEATTGPG